MKAVVIVPLLAALACHALPAAAAPEHVPPKVHCKGGEDTCPPPPPPPAPPAPPAPPPPPALHALPALPAAPARPAPPPPPPPREGERERWAR